VVLWLLGGQAGDAGSWAEDAVRRAQEVLPVFERAGDDVGSAAAYRLLAWAHGTACQFGEAAAAAQLAIEHANRAGDERQRRWASTQYGIAALWGPTPVSDAIESCEEIAEHARGDRRTEGLVKSLQARLEAMRGDFDGARALSREGRAMLVDMGKSVVAASTSLDSCGVEMLAGDLAAAERDLRRDYEALEEMGERYLLSTVAAELAGVLAEAEQDEEAERFSKVAEEIADEDDLTSQALWRWVRAKVLARRGQFDEALSLANEAVDLLGETDSLIAIADALVALSEVSSLAGRSPEALTHARSALDLYERKGDSVSSERTRALVARLAGEDAAPAAAPSSA
jgi:tetratricopeptide (TPR) repeat protein